MKECAARRSYMVSSLESVVGRSADLFVLHVPHVIAQADGKKTKQAGQKKHQKLEDVQDLIKIQETKNSLLAVMIGHFVSCLVSQNIYHTV